jgi:hypothetical protein
MHSGALASLNLPAFDIANLDTRDPWRADKACENFGPIDQGDGGENIEGVAGTEPIHF